jgi:uncharacterized membrane protein
VFELLFKYRLSLFQQGQLAFDATRPMMWLLVVVAAVLAVLVVVSYRRARARPDPRHGALLTALRLAALALLIVCLLRPVLVLSAAVPQRNTVAVLIDDSRSMRVADQDGRPRAEAVQAAFGANSALLAQLAEQFTLRFYRFSSAAERVDSVGALSFTGAQTRVGAALDRAREELGDVALAGVVVVTDGADGAPAALTDAALAMRARATPVFTVGVGREASERDLEITRVEAPRSVLQGTTISADVVLSHAGMGGRTVPVVVEDGGRIIATRDVTLPATGEAVTVRVPIPVADAGARRITVRVARQEGEALGENNERQLLVEVASRRERVLYYEGEPRFELKFVRRALADDENLQLVALQRTAENKYLRLGVRDSADLLGGFPTTREELFQYRAIILGSVEASAFSTEQLRLLADFVSERGGGLLMLGGRRAFAEGGYGGTALDDVVPVVLEGGARRDAQPAPAPLAELAVRLTPAGAGHAPLQLAATEQASTERWRTLPPLTAVNVVRRAKPGATVLLTGAAGGDRRVVLAYQRYGRGKAVAFPVQDSWLWQMHSAVAVDDMAHELFWRQMVRWLVSGVPDALSVTASTDRPAPGEPVTLRADVRDSTFTAVNGGSVVAEVTAPSGARVEVPMEWGIDRDGEYRAAFTPVEPGVHEVRVTRRAARAGGDAEFSEPVHFEAAESREEYYGSAMRAPLLRRLAQETGGRFYTPATLGALPEDLKYARAGITVVERKELWDMPIVFLLIAALVAGEWGWRRYRGLA